MRRIWDISFLKTMVGRTEARLPKTVAFTRELRTELRNGRLGDLAASTTFFTLFMLPAAVLALIASLGSLDSIVGAALVDDVRTASLDWVAETFGSEAAPITETVSTLFDQPNSGLATVSTLLAFWALARGFAGLIRALDVTYDIVERRSWLHIRIAALSLGLGTLGVIGLVSWMQYGLLSSLPDSLALDLLVRAAMLGTFVAWIATLFHVAPHHHTPWRYDVPGALVTAAAWFALTIGFGQYLEFAGRANDVLGVVSVVLAAMTLAHLMSYTLLFGAEVNSILARRAGVVQQPDRPFERLRDRRRG